MPKSEKSMTPCQPRELRLLRLAAAWVLLVNLVIVHVHETGHNTLVLGNIRGDNKRFGGSQGGSVAKREAKYMHRRQASVSALQSQL